MINVLHMNKRYCILLLLLGCFSFTALAQQDNSIREFSIGPSGGVNFSRVNFQPKVSESMLMQYNMGVMARYIGDKYVGLQLEVRYSKQGWKESFPAGSTAQYSHSIDYIDIPFMTHICTNGKRFQFFLNLGPQIGFAIGDKETYNFGADEKPNDRENAQHGMAIKNKFNWGLCGGPGVELKTGIGNFLLEGRVFFGLSDIFGNKKEDHFAASSNMNVSANFTYLIPIKRK